MIRHAAALLIFACAAGAQPSSVVFTPVFNGITAAAISPNVRNIGQAMHMIVVTMPKAVADVAAVQVRIEASYDNSIFFPISRDVTTVLFETGTGGFAVERANAAYPFVRVRAVAVSATVPMHVFYTGATVPIGNVIRSGGRLLASPAPGYDKATWGLCTTGNCAVLANITVPYIAVQASQFNICYLAIKTAPTGASIIVDIKRNGTTIFGAGTKLVVAAGALTGSQATFAAPTNAAGDQLTVDITQIGSTIPGRDLSIACRLAL